MLKWLLDTAALFGVELSERQIGGYLKQLSGFAEDKLEYAFSRVQQEWTEASKMPTPNFILIRCAEYSLHGAPAKESTPRELMEREVKPLGWEPVSREEIEQWKEAGKQRAKQQLAEIRKAVKELNPGFRPKSEGNSEKSEGNFRK